MDRRNFIFNSSLAVGAGTLLARCSPKSQNESVAEPAPSFANWTDIRKQFLMSPDKIHMTLMLLASHPKTVRDAISMHRQKLDENPTEYWESNYPVVEKRVREAASEYMGADTTEIALTDSTTMGLGTLYSGLRLNPGDEILTTIHDHYSTEKSLEFACIRNGASLKRVALYNNPAEASIDQMVNALKTGVTEKTRIIAITYVHSCTGVKTPVKQIAGMVKELNQNRKNRIYLCVDGVHGFGIEDITMADFGCDFFVAGTHKWIFGPRGTGVFFARKDAWDMITPTIPSFEDTTYYDWMGVTPMKEFSFSDLCSPGGFHSFEHRWALPEAFQFHLTIGKAKIQERSHQLSTLVKDGLSNIKHVRLITPRNEVVSAGINCFEVEGMKPDDVVKKLLARNIIASASPYKTSYVRFTPTILNNEDEIATCLKAVEQIKEA